MTQLIAPPHTLEAFRQAACEVLAMVLGGPVHNGAGHDVPTAIFPLEAVSVTIGLTGDLKGQFCLGASEEVARAVASTMMMEPVEAIDEMAISAWSELANMVGGAACAQLLALGLSVDITPPTALLGSGVHAAWHHTRTQSLPLYTPCGPITLMVGIQSGGSHER